MAGSHPKRARLKDLQRPGTGMTVGKPLASMIDVLSKHRDRKAVWELSHCLSAKLPQAVAARSAKRSHEAG